MSELKNQLTVTSVYELGPGNLLSLRKSIAETLKLMQLDISAFQIDKIRLISYGLVDGVRNTVIPGEGLFEQPFEGRSGSLTYSLSTDDVNLNLAYTPSQQAVRVSRSDNVFDIELAITIIKRDFKVAEDGYLYINIPVRSEMANGRESYPNITVEHGSFAEDGDLVKGTWEMEYGSFEPAFDAKGNIIAFNLINKP